MAQAVLIIGGNLGDVGANMVRTLELIGQQAGDVCALSSVYESEPWGFDAPEMFMNQVVCIKTSLQPMELLHVLQLIEQQMGRVRDPLVKCDKPIYHSRTMDIDILFYDNLALQTDSLTIPHPRLQQREFVLMPLWQVMGEAVLPVLGRTVGELLSELNQKTIKSKIK